MSRKVEMIPGCPPLSFLLLGALLAASTSGQSARADETGGVIRISDRCAVYGPGFIDLGSGVCGVLSGAQLPGAHVRAEPPTGATASGAWPNGGSSTTALRTDGLGMLPGANDARHLRVQSGVNPYER